MQFGLHWQPKKKKKKRVQYFISCAVEHFRQGEIEQEKFAEKWTIYYPEKWQEANDFFPHETSGIEVKPPHFVRKYEKDPILSRVKHLHVKRALQGRGEILLPSWGSKK